MAKAAALKKAPGTAVANIERQLAEEAKALAERVQAPQGQRIKVGKDKKFIMPNGEKMDALTVVIVDFAYRNDFYDRPYDEKNTTPPACFAISFSPKDIAPSKNSPVIQGGPSGTCADCPQNAFDSDPKGGRGKACKNSVLLALAGTSEDPDSPLLLLGVSPTGIKAFSGFVSMVAKMHNRSPVGVVCEITCDANVDYQSLRFANPSPNPNAAAHLARRAEARAMLEAEPDVSTFQPATRRGTPPKRGR